MLHREDGEGIILISQPAHGWVSGQIARHWGNETFFAPPEEVCLAAEQHDLGFLEWERAPTLNAERGLPHTFMDMPSGTHLHLWTTGIQQMLQFGRLPALLVSLHFTDLLGRHGTGTPEARTFLDAQQNLQTTLATSLRNDCSLRAPWSDDEITRFQQLISIWDWMSLLLCMRLRKDETIRQVPASKNGCEDIVIRPMDDTHRRYSVCPWPFCEATIQLTCEGRRLLSRHSNEEKMRAAIRLAPPVEVAFNLVPG
jgi:hypothetical protein